MTRDRTQPGRRFLRHCALVVGGTVLAGSAAASRARDAHECATNTQGNPGADDLDEVRVQDVIDLIISQCVDSPIPNTVDTVKTGDPSVPVSGIVSTFMATWQVIEKTVECAANLIVTHEPTFWSHDDDTQWLKNDPVYLAKRRLIDEHKIVNWRCHDYWHRLKPDPVNTGLLKELGWDQYADSDRNHFCTIPRMSLRELTELVKLKLGLHRVAVVGNPERGCRRVGIAVGASWGRAQMEALGQGGADVVLAGDVNEWEACEYVWDATAAGMNKGYIVIGHANSEEPGMKYLADWLRPMLPQIPITHVPAGDPFRSV